MRLRFREASNSCFLFVILADPAKRNLALGLCAFSTLKRKALDPGIRRDDG